MTNEVDPVLDKIGEDWLDFIEWMLKNNYHFIPIKISFKGSELSVLDIIVENQLAYMLHLAGYTRQQFSRNADLYLKKELDKLSGGGVNLDP